MIETVRLNQESVELDGSSWAILFLERIWNPDSRYEKVFEWWRKGENGSSEFVPWLGLLT